MLRIIVASKIAVGPLNSSKNKIITILTTSPLYYSLFTYCYGPSIISVIVTKRGHLRGGGLYRTSKTIG